MTERSQASGIIQNLKKQGSAYEELLEKAKMQKKAIGEDNEKVLFEVIDQKNPLIQEINRLEDEIEKSVKALPERERADLAKKAGPLIKEMEDTLEKLIDLEDTCQTSMRKKMIDVQDQFKDFTQRKKMLKGYGLGKENKPKYSKNV